MMRDHLDQTLTERWPGSSADTAPTSVPTTASIARSSGWRTC
jgi:hypothetical protein